MTQCSCSKSQIVTLKIKVTYDGNTEDQCVKSVQTVNGQKHKWDINFLVLIIFAKKLHHIVAWVGSGYTLKFKIPSKTRRRSLTLFWWLYIALTLNIYSKHIGFHAYFTSYFTHWYIHCWLFSKCQLGSFSIIWIK